MYDYYYWMQNLDFIPLGPAMPLSLVADHDGTTPIDNTLIFVVDLLL